MKMEQIECSETSAYIIQTPGNYSKENNIFRTRRKFEIKNTSPLWGETARHFRVLEKLRIKKTKFLTSLTFLLRRRDYKIIPRFLQFHHHIHFRAANRICQLTSFALLQERVHQNRRELDNTSRDLLEIHLRLAGVLSNSD